MACTSTVATIPKSLLLQTSVSWSNHRKNDPAKENSECTALL